MEVKGHTFLDPPQKNRVYELLQAKFGVVVKKKTHCHRSAAFECKEIKMAFALVNNVQWGKSSFTLTFSLTNCMKTLR